MANFTFDGSQNVTATKADNVAITADPQTFTGATDNGVNTTLTFGSTTLTITGTTLVDNNLPNVFVTGGTFKYLDTTNTNGAGTGNVLSFGGDFNQGSELVTSATSKLEILSGLTRDDTISAGHDITIGGKGSFLVFGDANADTIQQSGTAFDSTSIVNVNAGDGANVINFQQDNIKASIFAGGGNDGDQIVVVNSGFTTIHGGLDSTDAADLIAVGGVAGAAGTSQIYGNGGDDQIIVGFNGAIDSTSAATVFGGVGNDQIQAVGTKATISVLGNEGSDNIFVQNTGNTFITGGNQSGVDQSLDSADQIQFVGSGNALIFGNSGNDVINVNANTADTSNFSIYGGKDNDTINETAGAGVGKATVFIAGGEGGDTISAVGNGGGVTIYGGVSGSDSADGSDSITYDGSATKAGAANILANGGNDTININTLGQDTVNTVTVNGGAGKDVFAIADQTATSQKLTLTGGADADAFNISSMSNNKAAGQSITITDFATGTGNDSLTLATGTAGNLGVTGGKFATLQLSLDAATAASGGDGKAGAVVFSGDTYIVVNHDGGASSTFTAADQAIKLTGVTNLGDLAATVHTV